MAGDGTGAGNSASRQFGHDALRGYVAELFARHDVPADDARTCADALVAADLRGVYSHGVARVPQYCSRLRQGGTRARPSIAVDRVAPAAVLVDGDDGLGLVVARRAMAEAVGLARESGVGIAGVKRSSHFGMAALYVAQAAETGCLGFAFTNASRALPAHGGAEAFFGTSPIAFSAPAPDGVTFLVDMALSVIARGKVRLAASRGETIPEGVALDAAGRPTTDAKAAMEGGVVLPIGGVKGAALSWMNDILGGVYTGAAFGGEVLNPVRDHDKPQGTGHLFIAMRGDLFMPLGEFQARLADLDGRVKAGPTAAGFDEIMSPGEPEARRMAELMAEGISLPSDVRDALRREGEAVGVDWPFD